MTWGTATSNLDAGHGLVLNVHSGHHFVIAHGHTTDCRGTKTNGFLVYVCVIY
jgi:hypothetical protein